MIYPPSGPCEGVPWTLEGVPLAVVRLAPWQTPMTLGRHMPLPPPSAMYWPLRMKRQASSRLACAGR